MSMVSLFRKLREHELELGRLNEEKNQRRKNNLAFKYEIITNKSLKKDKDSDDENISLMIKKFNKFIKSKGKGKFRSEKNENQGSSSNYKCYGCGERGHFKADCPNHTKGEEKKETKFLKKKKAYTGKTSRRGNHKQKC